MHLSSSFLLLPVELLTKVYEKIDANEEAPTATVGKQQHPLLPWLGESITLSVALSVCPCARLAIILVG